MRPAPERRHRQHAGRQQASGTASTSASVMPAVAMATVRQVSRATWPGIRPSQRRRQEVGQELAVTAGSPARTASRAGTRWPRPAATAAPGAARSRTAGQPGRVAQARRRRRQAGMGAHRQPCTAAVATGAPAVRATGGGSAAVHRARAALGTGSSLLVLGVQRGQPGRRHLGAAAGRRPAAVAQADHARKCASASSTWCSVATSVTPRARASCTRRPAPGAARRVQRRQRLVDQPQRGRRQQRARQAHALALAAREPVDPLEELVGQVEAASASWRGRDVGG
jgi:hypothetical protein